MTGRNDCVSTAGSGVHEEAQVPRRRHVEGVESVFAALPYQLMQASSTNSQELLPWPLQRHRVHLSLPGLGL